MSFFNNLLRSFVGDEAESAPPPDLIFRHRLHGIGRALGLALSFDSEGNAAEFTAPYNDESYSICLVQQGDRVYWHALSNIRFPLRRVPPPLVEFLEDRNREMPKYDWRLINGQNQSYFALKAFSQVEALSVDLVKSAVGEMLLEVSSLDHAMRKTGYY